MADDRPAWGTYVMVTFKVTEDGEAGHPMDHIVLVAELDDDGQLTDAAGAKVLAKIRAEAARKVRRRG